MSLGQRIKEARKTKGLTQGELAEKCGIFQKDISKYENNDAVPYATTVKKIAEALEASTDYLLEMNTVEIKDVSLKNLVKELDSLPEKEKDAVKTIVQSLVKEYKGKRKK